MKTSNNKKGHKMKTRNIRVKTVNAARMIGVLLAHGYSAQLTNPPTTLNGGCSDPSCCPQHDCVGFVGILTNASGNKAHSLWRDAGIVSPQF